jgi:E3 ubiquitin-protein ligase EDD1
LFKRIFDTTNDFLVKFQVCLRSSPIYHIGAIGFTVTADGIPKVGQLMKAAWSMNDTCRFKIKTIAWYVLLPLVVLHF